MLTNTSAFVLALLLGAAACARDPETAAISTLEEGVAALESGNHQRSLAACKEAAQVLATGPDAVSCWLVSALRLNRWGEALAAIGRLREDDPGDPWAAAIEIELQRLANPEEVLSVRVENRMLAWACVSGGCAADEGSAQELQDLSPLLAALLEVARDRPENAQKLLSAPPSGSDEEDLLLHLQLSRRNYTELLESVPALCAVSGKPSTTLTRIALFLGITPAAGTRCSVDSHRPVSRPGRLPRGPTGYLDLAWHANSSPHMNDRDRADMLEGASSMRPDSGQLHLGAGVALMQVGELARAVYHLQRAIFLVDTPAMPLLYLYFARLLQSDPVRAARVLAQLEPDLQPEWIAWLNSIIPAPVL